MEYFLYLSFSNPLKTPTSRSTGEAADERPKVKGLVSGVDQSKQIKTLISKSSPQPANWTSAGTSSARTAPRR